nr:pilus assembly protein PilM [uncultured Enterobacter sp.]
MAFGHWQIGMHIQGDGVFCVALARDKSQWALRRWWQIPLPDAAVVNGQIQQAEALHAALRPWSKTLPRRHRIRVAIPAGRTLQKRLPRPAMQLRESQQASWVAATVARELDMASEDLRFDYTEDRLEDAFSVTAAQNRDVAVLFDLANALNLHIAAITPDACALQRFIPLLPPPASGLVWGDSQQWLWATRQRWGRQSCENTPTLDQLARLLGIAPGELLTCNATPADMPPDFDPWCAVPRLQPPLPANAPAFAIAIGLALGEAY